MPDEVKTRRFSPPAPLAPESSYTCLLWQCGRSRSLAATGRGCASRSRETLSRRRATSSRQRTPARLSERRLTPIAKKRWVVHARPFSRSQRPKSKISRHEAVSLPAGLARSSFEREPASLAFEIGRKFRPIAAGAATRTACGISRGLWTEPSGDARIPPCGLRSPVAVSAASLGKFPWGLTDCVHDIRSKEMPF